MSHKCGEPIRGHVHSTDASGGVPCPIYTQGSNAARTLASDEYIEIHSMEAIAATGTDLRVFEDVDAGGGTDMDAGEEIFRGTVGDNGGIQKEFEIPRALAPGVVPTILADAGVVDLTFEGTIRRIGRNNSIKPTWHESDFGRG